jgi:signal recognition particle GTPase
MIGIEQKAIEEAKIDEKQFSRVEAIIQSMTIEEREDVDILNGKRRRRIADGAGTTVQEVNKFIKQYTDTRNMMRSLMSGKGPMNKFMKNVMKEAEKLEMDKMSEAEMEDMLKNTKSLEDLEKFTNKFKK